jgi:hypothetical protein
MPKPPNSSGWPPRFRELAPNTHLHALGTIAAVYNELEFSLFCLFELYSLLDDEIAGPLFQGMTNANRTDFLGRCLDAKHGGDPVGEAGRYFIRCFSLCAENRNFLMHSTLHPGQRSNETQFMKSAKRGSNTIMLNANLKILRSVADSMFDVDTYGTGLFSFVALTAPWSKQVITNLKFNGVEYVPTLPRRPALPESLWKPAPTTPERPKPPPQSSRQRRESAQVKARKSVQ